MAKCPEAVFDGTYIRHLLGETKVSQLDVTIFI